MRTVVSMSSLDRGRPLLSHFMSVNPLMHRYLFLFVWSTYCCLDVLHHHTAEAWPLTLVHIHQSVSGSYKFDYPNKSNTFLLKCALICYFDLWPCDVTEGRGQRGMMVFSSLFYIVMSWFRYYLVPRLFKIEERLLHQHRPFIQSAEWFGLVLRSRPSDFP